MLGVFIDSFCAMQTFNLPESAFCFEVDQVIGIHGTGLPHADRARFA
jgi:hypothetical protein